MDADSSQLALFDDSRAVRVAVRESARARRLTVRVFLNGRVEVVVPRRTPRRAVEAFLERHRDWIERRRAIARRNARPPEPFPPQTVPLTAIGAAPRVHVTGGTGRLRASFEGEWLRVAGAARDPEHLREVLRDWLIGAAREHLGARLSALAAELGFEYARLSVRRQRSRWGSCSARGTISLNCCLMFQRPEVVRYLMIHELAHTRHMHHGVRFWQCVGRHCADYRALDQELLAGWRRVPSWVFGDGGMT